MVRPGEVCRPWWPCLRWRGECERNGCRIYRLEVHTGAACDHKANDEAPAPAPALTDQAIVKIEDLILTGEFQAGAKLPPSETWPRSSGCRATRCARRSGP